MKDLDVAVQVELIRQSGNIYKYNYEGQEGPSGPQWAAKVGNEEAEKFIASVMKWYVAESEQPEEPETPVDPTPAEPEVPSGQ